MLGTNQTEVNTAIALKEEAEDTPIVTLAEDNVQYSDGVSVDYSLICDLETKREGAAFECEEELEDGELRELGRSEAEPLRVEVNKAISPTPTQGEKPLNLDQQTANYTELAREEIINKSGVSEEIFKSAFELLTNEKSKEITGNSYLNCEWAWRMKAVKPIQRTPAASVARVKPNRPHTGKDGKPQKYINQSGSKKGVKDNSSLTPPMFAQMPDRDYWRKLSEDKSTPLVITEGEKKAACLLSRDIACVALAGVDCWNNEKGSKELNEWLIDLELEGRTVFIWFDADYITNKRVSGAMKSLGDALTAAGAIVKVVTHDGSNNRKGLDDFLVKTPGAKAQECLDAAVSLTEALAKAKDSEGGLQVTQGKQPKNPPFKGSRAANHLAEKYRAKLAWNTEINMFMKYGYKHDGVWSVVAPEAVVDVISSEMDNGSLELDGCPGHSHNEAMSVFNLLKGKLIRGEWKERDNSLPFENGILDIKTGQLLPHSPLNYFTWQIPRSHNPKAEEFPKISNWLNWVSDGDEQFKLLLLSWLNAVLVGRSDLHKFFNAYGTGRNGKGLFQNIAIALIGENNVHTSDLRTWNDNHFEASNAYGKRLIVMPDEDKCKGGIGEFKKVTGGDLLRCERKGKDATNFTYTGMVMLSSNYPVFQGENSTALNRRTILAQFSRTISEEEQKGTLLAEFVPELSALTNYLLAMDNELVIKTLKGLNASERMKESTQAYQIRSNPLYAWVEDYLEYEEGGEESVGKDREDPITLYGSYCKYCKNAGNSPKSLQNFSADLVDLLTNTLGWKGVKKRSSSRGKTEKFKGARGSFIDNVKIILSGDLA